MPERPLLLFPTPVSASRTKLGGGGGSFHKPTPARQWEKISPALEQLQNAFVQVQPNADGIEPERVLVIETVGAVENFVNAVKKVEGFEWLGEMDKEGIGPDDDFYDERHREKPLSGRLYWVLSNQQALQQMLSLWKRYKDAPDMDFKRGENHGLAKFKSIFLQLKDIRRWNTLDRLEETGVLSAWRENLQDAAVSDTPVHCEIELWFRGNENKRNQAQRDITQHIEQAGGQIVSQATIPEISYHALLATLPRNQIQSILAGNRNVSFLQCDSVQFFRPCGQMVFGRESTDEEPETTDANADQPLPTGSPIIALFDGLPLENHALLSGRLTIDDPDDYTTSYTAAARKHGTTMASLIVQGDLNDGQNPLPRPIYVRPIMRPKQDHHGRWQEYVPENVLFTDLLHRSVRRLLSETEDGRPPVAPTIKIINLSIGDPARQFVNAMSPVAKLLDYLSEKHNVLFVISAGNHPEPIRLDQTWRDISALSPDEREAEVIKALYSGQRNRRLLAPAETINGLTIGALHSDSSAPAMANRIDLLSHNFLPSPVSAFGGGYRRTIKPEIIFHGGRQLYAEPVTTAQPTAFNVSEFIVAPGNKAASPNPLGKNNATSFSRGTSNATALVSRSAGICYDSLMQLLDDQPNSVDLDGCDVALLKTMLVHGCSWGEAKSRLGQILEQQGLAARKSVSRWMGYGVPDVQRVLECTRQRATILGFGKLSDEQAHLFNLPLPPSLGQQNIKRRLTVTLAWFSRIVPTTQKYRGASLWFEVPNNRIASQRQECDDDAVQRGTIQHEIFEGEQAEPIIDGHVLQIKVNCRKDADKIANPVAYGLAVSLEIAESVDIDIYSEIQTRIATSVQIQP